MTAELKKLFTSLQNRDYKPFYLVDGEEAFYLDLITEYFEHKILNEAERDFNLMVMYGKDADWADVVNACRRFPMFAEKQVVILKDASQLKGFNELAGYLEHPAPTTIFLIEHRGKKTDGRSKIVKLAKDKGFHFTSDKLKDEQVPNWIQGYGKEINFHVGEREAQILATYLGNDLQKIVNEIEKVRINVPGEQELTSALIQKYIGISKDYNVFEFPETITNGDKDKLYRMLAYFIANPKSAPMVLIVGSCYNHFNKIYQSHFLQNKSDKDMSAALGVWPSKAKEYIGLSRRIPLQKVEYCMMLLSTYNTYSVGIGNNTGDRELLKEMIGKIELALS